MPHGENHTPKVLASTTKGIGDAVDVQHPEARPSQPVSLTEGQNLAFLQPNPLEESPCLVMAVLLLRRKLRPKVRETTPQPSSFSTMALRRGYAVVWGAFWKSVGAFLLLKYLGRLLAFSGWVRDARCLL